ncbi:zinc-binding alcohol dehydrogenase family protein [Metabacillus halosaccharovorans]|uniref:zinc-binding alcohol dehydrogenase family protein n=1 Tax=Metabacillus halosaccharovorans TaxID=930124 RepID=UPI001C1F7CFC|nr:zinc-binding alcohol dehydrogenase family protein [Metabacillus halosaccharovorans]MBU7592663.1 zinc-binding alcohol dehydrogenase family protein [Metabacillus halosaccharovorans]
MKVISCEKPKRFVEKEEEIPMIKQGEVLIKVKSIGICGTDIHAFYGNQPFFTYPRVLGHELSGEIVEAGVNDCELKAGDSVAVLPYLECGKCIACRQGKTNCCTNMKVFGVHIDGGMKEYIKLPIDHVIKINGISFDQGAMIEPLSIGAHAVRRSKIRDNQFALVIGGGPIGLGVMKFAKLAGAKVIAMDINEERLQFCKDWAQADFTINAREEPVEAITMFTNGDFPEVVFDATGNKSSMMNAFQYVSHGGLLVYVGLVKDDITFNDPEFHKREMSLLGSRNATREDFKYVISCVENGDIDVNPIITKRLKLNDIAAGFEVVTNPTNNIIKAIIEV